MDDECTTDTRAWKLAYRPGMLGSKKVKIISSWNATYGKGNWKLVWQADNEDGILVQYDFEEACKKFYERSYLEYFKKNPAQIDYVCQFGECIDNAATNIVSGLDYMVQEAKATHIQDIAVRSCLKALGRSFGGSKDNLLVIRSTADNGGHLSPGFIPFYDRNLIEQPSKCPRWANPGSVEDFWQSNKWLAIREG